MKPLYAGLSSWIAPMIHTYAYGDEGRAGAATASVPPVFVDNEDLTGDMVEGTGLEMPVAPRVAALPAIRI
jgi:hypothetical protein